LAKHRGGMSNGSMEKAAYKLWITDQSVLDIALSVGFKNHET
jgi:hypothetical protein